MPKVMVVDDTDSVREPVVRLLRREGYETVWASSGAEALAAIDEADPDLVLLDFMMPDMDGLTMLERLRRNPLRKDVPVVMMTAVLDRETVRRAQDLGAKEYLVKSHFTVDLMLETIRQHLRKNPANPA